MKKFKHMHKLSKEVIQFFLNQGCVIVNTIDGSGYPHSACKGIVELKEDGQVYLLDLYHGTTYNNLKENRRISITAVDEHKFRGYCLKGTVKLTSQDEIDAKLIEAWEARITSRLTQRVLKNIGGYKGHARHPEALLPKPKYLIAIQVEEIVDLTPAHIV